jgi:hypothetical protein
MVRPGRPDALLVYFQHDGLCIPKTIPSGQRIEACGQNASERTSTRASAILDALVEILGGYTVLEVRGCTGDAYSGALQRGYWNTKAALRWARRLSLRDLVVAGEASGAWGVALWASTLLDTFAYETATVLVSDFPYQLGLSTAAYLYVSWGTCATPLLDVTSCENGDTHGVLKHVIAKHGASAFFAVVQALNDDFSIEACDLAAQSLSIIHNSYCRTEGSSHVFLSLGHWSNLRNFAFYLSVDDLPNLSWLAEAIGHTARSHCSGTTWCAAIWPSTTLSVINPSESSQGASLDSPRASSIPSVPKAMSQTTGLGGFLNRADATRHVYYRDEALGMLVGLAILTMAALLYMFLRRRSYEAVLRQP